MKLESKEMYFFSKSQLRYCQHLVFCVCFSKYYFFIPSMNGSSPSLSGLRTGMKQPVNESVTLTIKLIPLGKELNPLSLPH